MKRTRLFVLGVLATLVFSSMAQAQSSTVPVFTITPVQSRVSFYVKSSVKLEGTFEKWEATLVFTSTDASTGVLDIKIQADSVNTGSKSKDEKLKGEHCFEVAKNPNRPFVVVAGSKRVIAVGTAFSVRRNGNDVRVAVTEGRVRIDDAGERPASADAGDDGAATFAAGSVARATDAGVLIQHKPVPEIENDLSWRTGYLAFDKTLLADAVAEFNRYNARKIVIEDPVVAGIRVGGNFRATNIDAFVRLIESDFPIRATEDANGIILTGVPPPQK